MSGLDVGLLLLAAAGAGLGLKIGAVTALFAFVGGVAGGFAAGRLCGLFHGIVSPSAAYLISFFLVAGVFLAVGVAVRGSVESFFWKTADRLVGAALGVCVSLALAVGLLVPMLLSQGPAVKDLVRRSTVAPGLLRLTQKGLRLAPKKVWDDVSSVLEGGTDLLNSGE